MGLSCCVVLGVVCESGYIQNRARVEATELIDLLLEWTKAIKCHALQVALGYRLLLSHAFKVTFRCQGRSEKLMVCAEEVILLCPNGSQAAKMQSILEVDHITIQIHTVVSSKS